MKPTIHVAIVAAAVIYSADAKKDKDVVTVDATLDELGNTSPTYAPTTSTYAPTIGEPEVSDFFPFALFLSSLLLLWTTGLNPFLYSIALRRLNIMMRT